MAEVKVSKELSPAKREAAASSALFRPMFPIGRHLGWGCSA